MGASSPKVGPLDYTKGVEFVDLETLLQKSDFVTIHAALTDANQGMMGEAELKQMKPTALLVNSARGGHVQESALMEALKQGVIAGAALDAYVQEPLPEDHPYRTTPNLLMSPHQASSSLETGERISLAAAEAIVDLLEGRTPGLLVNPEVLDQPQLRASKTALGNS